MKICTLLISDGRDEARSKTIRSYNEMLGQADALVEIDDRDHELGFAGAIQAGWDKVLETDADYVFHLEQDFTFNASIPLARMIAVLQRHPRIVQMGLKRQPCNPQEEAAGGIVECSPDDFRQRHEAGNIWTEHRRYFTTTPSVYPVDLCTYSWPQVPNSEGIFTHRLFEDPDAVSAFWGPKFDPPLIEHIGEREGVGY